MQSRHFCFDHIYCKVRYENVKNKFLLTISKRQRRVTLVLFSQTFLHQNWQCSFALINTALVINVTMATHQHRITGTSQIMMVTHNRNAFQVQEHYLRTEIIYFDHSLFKHVTRIEQCTHIVYISEAYN